MVPAIVLFALFLSCLEKPTTLIDLQREILVARTDNERQAVLNRLNAYYLNQSIPDSIVQQVEIGVTSKIDAAKPLSAPDTNVEADSNVYVIEDRLSDWIRFLMIARSRSDDAVFKRGLSHAINLTSRIKTEPSFQYWQDLIKRISGINREEARSWLGAREAERLCRLTTSSDYKTAELYGCYGLQRVNHFPDARTQLDIKQRLLVILRKHRGFKDLSYPLFEESRLAARLIGYHLRETGFLFNHGEALFSAGRYTAAAELFRAVILKSQKYDRVPQIDWYHKSGLLGLAKISRRQGYYRKCLSLCEQAKKMDLDTGQNIVLHNTAGITYLYLGNVDKAEKEYLETIKIARAHGDHYNESVTLRNLGLLFFRLSEYDKASHYYEQAITSLELSNIDESQHRGRWLINLAESKAELGELDACMRLMQRAEELIQDMSLPTVKGELLQSIGRLNQKLANHEQALVQFGSAIRLYDQNGLFREGLDTRILMGQSLIRLKMFPEARKILSKTLEKATQFDDIQSRIEAMGLLAEVAYQQGDRAAAILQSNRMIRDVDFMSRNFQDLDNLTFYQHKMFPYLKNSVLYEIRLGRIDSAFIKLDHLKARVAKKQQGLNTGDSIHKADLAPDLQSIQSALLPNRILISYFLVPDTLYAFVLTSDSLSLFRSPIHYPAFERSCRQYNRAIHVTPQMYKYHQKDSTEFHYRKTRLLSTRLFSRLFGWPDLLTTLRNAEITYVIPDDCLHKIPFQCLSSDQDYLINQTAVVTLPSAVFLNSNPTPIDRNPRWLISADSDFRGTKHLLESIHKQNSEPVVLTVRDSLRVQEEMVDELSRGSDLCLLIGHCKPDTLLPDSSTFLLSVHSQSEKKDQRIELSLYDLKRVDWSNTNLVCLVGCETASGKIYQGSGLSGIQQSLLNRGAQRVLASHWQIDAETALSQMTDFLDLWSKNRDAATALQQIQRKAIARFQGDPYFGNPHPYFWGSFCLAQTVR